MRRADRQFEFGPLSLGIYRALLWIALLVPLYFPAYTVHYFFLLVFLGLGLRPLLEITGLWVCWERLESPFGKRWSDKELDLHRRKIEARQRQEALRRRRVREG